MGTTFTFRLAIDGEELMRYYRGDAQAVVVEADDGRTVRFPASRLREHVGVNGVHGRFRLRVDADNRFVAMERVGS